MAIKVRLKTLKNGNPEIIHPETDWSIVLNRPSIAVDNNGETWSNGSSIRLDGNHIYVKDYLRDEVLLENYPINVKWSAVQYKPSITVGENTETWSKSGSSIRLGANNIYVKDVATSNNEKPLEDYPIKWSAIYGTPSYLKIDKEDMVFGRYSTVEQVPDQYQVEEGDVYPAVRKYHYRFDSEGPHYTYTTYYWSGSTWAYIGEEKNFIPGL